MYILFIEFIYYWGSFNDGYLVLELFTKKDILYWFNIINFLHYKVYKIMKYILINIYYYLMRLFLIVVYSNMRNVSIPFYIQNFYKIKESVLWYIKYFNKRFLKKNRLWKTYYKFHLLDYLKIVFFIFAFIIFFLMWKRRNTYKKRSFFIILLKFYLYAIFISYFLVALITNTFIAILLSLILSFFLIFIKLN